MNLAVCLVSLIFGPTAGAYNILILAPWPSYSHQQPMLKLAEALIKRGHQLFVVNPNKIPGMETKYTHIDVSLPNKASKLPQMYTNQKDMAKIVGEAVGQTLPRQYKSETFLTFQRRVKDENIKFDVIIGQAYLMPWTCGMSRLLAPGKPIIALSTFALDLFTEESMGSLPHPSFVPYETPFTDRMSFWQRAYNLFVGTRYLSNMRQAVEETARAFFKESYGSESVVDNCWGNASLTLISSNALYFYPRPLAPNVIELGPLHIHPPPKLPQDWIDGAEKGVIYFCLGSNVRSSSLPTDAISNFLRLFKQLPSGYRILWKWELDGKIPGQSDNILAAKWVPQQSILAHPKVRLYISQGGIQSVQEGIHYGVPMVVIPHFGDQETNGVKIVDAKIGVLLMPHSLNSYEEVKSAIETALFDESYMTNMKRMSAISHEFTTKSEGKAVFWVEHVAKFGGASYLRPSAADATYIEYFCLDILSVILVMSLMALYLMIFIFKTLAKVFCPSSSKLKKD